MIGGSGCAVTVATDSSQCALITMIAEGFWIVEAMLPRCSTISWWSGSPNTGNGPPPCEIKIADDCRGILEYVIGYWSKAMSFPRSALYMDSSSLANRFRKQNSDAFIYSAFGWRRYLLARYVYALRFL
jgi:hypothetical protein